MHTLMGKVTKDAAFGLNNEFKSLYVDTNNNNDSALSSNSSSDMSNNQPTANPDKVIVDLDLIVEKWITYMWEKTKTKTQSSKYEFDELEVIVNWSKADILQEDAKFEGGNVHHASIAPSQQTLFRTYFNNRTDNQQNYSFKTDRTTRQSCSFSFIKGFCREKEAAVGIKIPGDIIELGGGMRSEQSIECGKDKTNEEEVTWGVDSSVTVQPKTRTRADLIINEISLNRKFTILTKIKGKTLEILKIIETKMILKCFFFKLF
jgi:hypothetical protein